MLYIVLICIPQEPTLRGGFHGSGLLRSADISCRNVRRWYREGEAANLGCAIKPATRAGGRGGGTELNPAVINTGSILIPLEE